MRRVGVVANVGESLAHHHAVVIMYASTHRWLGKGWSLAAALGAEAQRQPQHAGVVGVQVARTHAEFGGLLERCVPKRPGRVRGACPAQFGRALQRLDVDALLIVQDDELAAGVDAGEHSPGVGVFTRRHENNELRGMPLPKIRAVVVVEQGAEAFVGRWCMEQVNGHQLEQTLDPQAPTLADVPWLRAELFRAFSATIERALARSGISPGYLAECDPKEGRVEMPFNFREQGSKCPSQCTTSSLLWHGLQPSIWPAKERRA